MVDFVMGVEAPAWSLSASGVGRIGEHSDLPSRHSQHVLEKLHSVALAEVNVLCLSADCVQTVWQSCRDTSARPVPCHFPPPLRVPRRGPGSPLAASGSGRACEIHAQEHRAAPRRIRAFTASRETSKRRTFSAKAGPWRRAACQNAATSRSSSAMQQCSTQPSITALRDTMLPPQNGSRSRSGFGPDSAEPNFDMRNEPRLAAGVPERAVLANRGDVGSRIGRDRNTIRQGRLSHPFAPCPTAQPSCRLPTAAAFPTYLCEHSWTCPQHSGSQPRDT